MRAAGETCDFQCTWSPPTKKGKKKRKKNKSPNELFLIETDHRSEPLGTLAETIPLT